MRDPPVDHGHQSADGDAHNSQFGYQGQGEGQVYDHFQDCVFGHLPEMARRVGSRYVGIPVAVRHLRQRDQVAEGVLFVVRVVNVGGIDPDEGRDQEQAACEDDRCDEVDAEFVQFELLVRVLVVLGDDDFAKRRHDRRGDGDHEVLHRVDHQQVDAVDRYVGQCREDGQDDHVRIGVDEEGQVDPESRPALLQGAVVRLRVSVNLVVLIYISPVHDGLDQVDRRAGDLDDQYVPEQSGTHDHGDHIKRYDDDLCDGYDVDLSVSVEQELPGQREEILDKQMAAQHDHEHEGIEVGKSCINEFGVQKGNRDHVDREDEGDLLEELLRGLDDPADGFIVLLRQRAVESRHDDAAESALQKLDIVQELIDRRDQSVDVGSKAAEDHLRDDKPAYYSN